MSEAIGLVGAVPAPIFDGPWTGDGPSIGVGNAPDDMQIGEVEYIAAAFVVQHKRIAVSPVAMGRWWDLAGPVYYPSGDDITVGISPMTEMLFEQASHGTHEPFRLVDSPRAMGAPNIVTGDFTNLGKS